MRQGRSAGPGRTETAERAGFFWDLDAADGRKFDSCGDAERLSLKLRSERFGVPRASTNPLFEPLPNLPSRPPAARPMTHAVVPRLAKREPGTQEHRWFREGMDPFRSVLAAGVHRFRARPCRRPRNEKGYRASQNAEQRSGVPACAGMTARIVAFGAERRRTRLATRS